MQNQTQGIELPTNSVKIRPHHVLDILTTYGAGDPIDPPATGGALHTVARTIMGDPRRTLVLVVGADDVCRPCSLLKDGVQCTNVLRQVTPNLSMQRYNDDLDRKILEYLALPEGVAMTMEDYCRIIRGRMPEITGLCTHPGENRDQRALNLAKGLDMLLEPKD
jgi:hypothetical protein